MKLAVIIPCLNEEITVGRVIEDCRTHLPTATVYVLDNGSVDATAANARAHGATVIPSPLRGKGHALRHAFRVINADYYLMIDGDGTYPVSEAPRLIGLAAESGYEMVMGARLKLGRREAFRPLHYLGNRLFTFAVRALFGFPVQDLLTGYRVFSNRFAREVHLISPGFEIETELTIRAMAQDMAFCEVAIPYVERPPGSRSKLRTFRDGWRISLTILRHLRDFRPLLFYGVLAALTFILSLVAPTAAAAALAYFAPGSLLLGFYFSGKLGNQKLWLKARHPWTPGEAPAPPTGIKIKAAG